jgi:CheY-like chemotaxis protein
MTNATPKILNILSAEDGLDNQLLIRLFLKEYPCRITTAANGEEAVRLYARNGYDVVLMDMQMPVMDGYAATREIRKMEREGQRNPAHIIALTAYTSDDQLRRCMRAGCNHILPKPLSHQKLWKMLNHIQTEPVQLVFLKEDLQDLMPGYIHNRYVDLQQLPQFLQEANYEGIALIGHKMKGSGSGYGLDYISRMGRAIETAAALEQSSVIEEAVRELGDYLGQLKVIYMGYDREEES